MERIPKPTAPCPPLPLCAAQEAMELMQQCGSLHPAARPTAQQVLQRLAALVEAMEKQQANGNGAVRLALG